MTSPTPSFRIHRADGSVVSSLQNAFVTKRDVTIEEAKSGEITFTDGSIWRLIIDSATYEAIAVQSKAYCIISFQVHTYGSFAVAKLFRSVAPKPRSGLNRMRMRNNPITEQEGEKHGN